MTIDDSIIQNSITKLVEIINEKNLLIQELNNLKTTFVSLQRIKQQVKNKTGGFDLITIIPNPHNLTEDNNNKTRQIYYDNCIKKYTDLGL